MSIFQWIAEVLSAKDVIEGYFIYSDLEELGPLTESELNANALGCGSTQSPLYHGDIGDQVRGDDTPTGMQVW